MQRRSAPTTFASAFRGSGQTFAAAFTGARPVFGAATEARIRANTLRTVDAAREFRAEAEAHMRRYAPWQDRTGEARRRLSVRELVAWLGRSVRVRLIFAHGVFYGRFLEYANAGRFAILGPTRQALVPAIRRRLRAIWRADGLAISVRTSSDVSSRNDPRTPGTPWQG